MSRLSKNAVAVLLSALAAGCVERTITVRSDPPAAYVYFEGKEIGQTPVTVSFVHHGTRKVTVYKPGYEKLHAMEEIKAPWFQWFPIDFFTEVLWPGKLKEEHVLDYKLEPAKEVPTDDLFKRAEDLRNRAYHIQP
ncbi:MAG: PEGA domain-containing protein [Planctomycetota bacterium]